MSAFTLSVNIDCADIDEMARFWSAAKVVLQRVADGRSRACGLRQCSL